MVEIICSIISGVFAVISAVFGGISIHNHKQINKNTIKSGNGCVNIQSNEGVNDKK